MELKDNTYLEHADDKFLWWAKLIVNILFGIDVALCVILGIIFSIKVSLLCLICVFVGPIVVFIAWVFVRVFLSLCHDVKIIRNQVVSAKTENNSTTKQLKEPTANAAKEQASKTNAIKTFCMNCGYEYNEVVGDPTHGVAPDTRFNDIPNNWTCPLCGGSKDKFSIQ